ncbi:MAG: very short patch repair endonuclease [Treponema sp.]|jgi:DNA mismatch endonuclease Vsr|nr:very short patch repair endonuclease [Treponema sp.]
MPDIFDSQKRSLIMRTVKNKNTAPEVYIQSLISGLGYVYEFSYAGLDCKPDILISTKKKAFFINGCFWHGHDCKRGHLPSTNTSFWAAKIAKNQGRDSKNYENLREAGWDYLIIWGCEIKKKNSDNLKAKILDFIGLED